MIMITVHSTRLMNGIIVTVFILITIHATYVGGSSWSIKWYSSSYIKSINFKRVPHAYPLMIMKKLKHAGLHVAINNYLTATGCYRWSNFKSGFHCLRVPQKSVEMLALFYPH